MINRGLPALDRMRALNGEHGPLRTPSSDRGVPRHRVRVEDTKWPRIVTLYGELAEVAPSPIVELNRAVAVSMASGPEVAVDLVDQLGASGTRDGCHLFHGVRGDLLAKLGRSAEAAGEFRRASSSLETRASATLLLERAEALHDGEAPGPDGSMTRMLRP